MNTGLPAGHLPVTARWLLGTIDDLSRRAPAVVSAMQANATQGGLQVTIGYLDPGSGSLIASAVVGGAAAAGVAVRQARHRLTSRFSRKRDDAEATAQEAEPGGDPATTDA
jgi:hypothetical protein